MVERISPIRVIRLGITRGGCWSNLIRSSISDPLLFGFGALTVSKGRDIPPTTPALTDLRRVASPHGSRKGLWINDLWGETLKGYRSPLAVYPWQSEIEEPLARRYHANGWSQALWQNDWAMLRRTCGAKHPREITLRELEDSVLRASAQGSRHSYVARLHSLFNSLRLLGLIPAHHRPDEGLPKIRRPRATPRPISKEQAEYLMANGRGEFAEFFALGCLSGLRALEVSRIEGSWLEQSSEGPSLYIHGKGNTRLSIAAHPRVVAIVESHRTLGRLYAVTPNKVSEKASAEMRRLGVNASFHACRHFFATELLSLTSDLLLVSEMMRHQSLNTTRGYAALKQGKQRQALDQLFAEEVVKTHGFIATA